MFWLCEKPAPIWEEERGETGQLPAFPTTCPEIDHIFEPTDGHDQATPFFCFCFCCLFFFFFLLEKFAKKNEKKKQKNPKKAMSNKKKNKKKPKNENGLRVTKKATPTPNSFTLSLWGGGGGRRPQTKNHTPPHQQKEKTKVSPIKNFLSLCVHSKVLCVCVCF